MSRAKSAAGGRRSLKQYALGALLIAVTAGTIGLALRLTVVRPDPAQRAIEHPIRYQCRKCGHQFEAQPVMVRSGGAEEKPAVGPVV